MSRGADRPTNAGDLPDAKRLLRRRIGGLRRNLAQADARSAAEAIARCLLREFAPYGTRRWALYAALPDEVSMRPLFDALRSFGQEPLLPRVRGQCLEFAPVHAWADLHRGRFMTLQPPWGVSAQSLRPGDVVVLPGLAFDRAGNRLGRGGGFYDRAFGGQGSVPLLIGAGYAFQLVTRVPHGSRDRRVDAIVTERGIVWPRG